MIKKINKKMFFGASLLVSGILSVLFSFHKKDSMNLLSLITDVPLSSIERVTADDGSGDCSGSSCDYTGWTPPPSSSSVQIDITLVPIPSSCGGGGCFIAGTKVLLVDSSEKSIEDVTTDDILLTSSGKEEVMKRYHIPYTGLIFAFNGDENYFVTPTHPFMTTDGWKSLDPEGTRKESPDIEVSLLAVGDTLVMHNNETKTLTQLDSKEVTTTVYNFGVNGTHEFYADGYLVHNVDTKPIEYKKLAIVMEK